MVGIGFDVRRGAGMRDDGHFIFAQIFIDATVLEFSFLIPSPAALARLAEGWMIHGEDECAVRFQCASGVGKDGVEWIDVLDGEIADDAVEGGRLEEMREVGCVAEVEADVFWSVFAGLFDQRFRCIESVDRSGLCRQEFGEGALSAGEIEIGTVFARSKQAQSTGEDDGALVVTAFFAHVAGIPAGDGLPGGFRF